MIWECKNYEWYENIELWKIWECKIMNDMRMYKLWMIWECKNYEWYEIIKTKYK